ncbi:MAG: sulfatase-like hydrolase/transferase [Actinomycetota bacterium]|nr:sulfatase-like hydrolase/transferase [Actinomycetota bacterium]
MRKGSAWRSLFEIAGCWSLAISWPVFQRFDSGAEVLTMIEARGMDLLLFTVLVAFAGPVLLMLAELLARRFISDRMARIFHASVLGVLLGLVVWQVLQASPVLAMLALAAIAVLVTCFYLRSELLRNFALMLGIATPVVLGLFLFSYPIRAEVLPGKPAMPPQKTESMTPVVMVVLDELPLALLLDGNGELDEKLIPELKPLAGQSSFYPQTLAVGDQTLSAMPAIMTGEEAAKGEDRPPPGLPGYPDNLCSITADAAFVVRAEETITDLCPRQAGSRLVLAQLLRTGMSPDYVTGAGETERLTPGSIFEDMIGKFTGRYQPPPPVYGAERPALARGFIENLDPVPRSVSLLHLIMPHAPFQFLPDGRGYPSLVLGDEGTRRALEDPVSEAETLKHMQQNIAQTRFSLKLVNDLIDRMKELGVWDESLFVVTADHGASFKVGKSRRTIEEGNEGWLLPVPLFIKYPDQEKGEVISRPVSSKDITPTVLDVLGLKPSPRATGQSLFNTTDNGPGPREIEVTSTDEEDFIFDTNLIRKNEREAVRLKAKGFASGSLYAIGGRAELLGRTVKGNGRWESVEAGFMTGGPVIEADPDAIFSPAYVQAELPGLTSDPGTIAVAVNGKVAATTRAWQRDGKWMTGVNVPPDAFRKGENTLALYRPPGR